MKTIARLRYLNIAPRKVRLVADLIRGKSAKEARRMLSFVVKRSAKPILQLLNSAVANAKNNFQTDESNLYIAKIDIDGGPIRKKWRARARGSASRIQKRTSHISLFLQEIDEKSSRSKKAAELSADQSKDKETGRTPRQQRPRFRSASKTARPVSKQDAKKMFRRKAF